MDYPRQGGTEAAREATERMREKGTRFPCTAIWPIRARSPGLPRQRGGMLYVELAEEILYARPEDENEAKAALEWVGVRDGKQLAEWIERRRRLLSAPETSATT